MDQLYLIEVLVDKIIFDPSISEVPDKSEINVAVTFGKYAKLDIKSDGFARSCTEKKDPFKRELSIDSGKSYLFPTKAEELIKALSVSPLELILTTETNSAEPIGFVSIPWVGEFIDMVDRSRFNPDNLKPVNVKGVYQIMANDGGLIGDMDIFIRLSCFGQNIQTQFQIVQGQPILGENAPKRFFFKSANTTTTIQAKQYGEEGTASEVFPVAPIFNPVDPNWVPKAPLIPADMTAAKINQVLCKNRDCPGVQKFKEFGLGPAATGAGLGTIFGPTEIPISYGLSHTYGSLENYGPYGLYSRPKTLDQPFIPKEPVDNSEFESLVKCDDGCSPDVICQCCCPEPTNDNISNENVCGCSDPLRLSGGSPGEDENKPPEPMMMCKELMQSYDKVLNEYKKAMGPCGQVICPFAPNVVEETCKKHCKTGETDYQLSMTPAGLGAATAPRGHDNQVSACGVPTCSYSRNVELPADKSFQHKQMKSACGSPTCPFTKNKLGTATDDDMMEIQLMDNPAVARACGAPKCPFPLPPVVPPLEPIHWDCPDPLPKGPCRNPQCPLKPPELRYNIVPQGPCGSAQCPYATPSFCGDVNCPFGPPQPCPYAEPPACPPPPPPDPSCVPGCGMPCIPPSCGGPSCPSNPCPPRPCPPNPCTCGRPGCPAFPFNCGDPDCPLNPQPLPCPAMTPCPSPPPCGGPRCPYPLCGGSPCPSSPCGPPPCPPPCPPSPCGGPSCPNTPPCPPPRPSPCGNLSCPFAEPQPPSTSPCGSPMCPYANPPMGPCGSPVCKYAKPPATDNDVCANPECPFATKKESPCYIPPPPANGDVCPNPQCPFAPKPANGGCGNPSCPFVTKKPSPCFVPPKDSVCSNPVCPFTPPQQAPCPYIQPCELVVGGTKLTVEYGVEKKNGDNGSLQGENSCGDGNTAANQQPCTPKTCKAEGGDLECNECVAGGGGGGSGGTIQCPCGGTITLSNSPRQSQEILAPGNVQPSSQSAPAIGAPKSGKELKRNSQSEKAISGKNGKNGKNGKTGKKPSKTKYVYKLGDLYPGVNVGHKECIIPGRNVPAKMGWLWNTHTPCVGLKPRLGWRPGAVGRTIANKIMAHRKAKGLKLLAPLGATPKGSKRKLKAKYSAYESDSDATVAPKPTLLVKKREGCYYITMNPLKDPKTIEDNENPYMDCTPLQFKICKNKDKEDENKTCFCGDDEESSDSELDIEFTPPAGIIRPERLKRKKNVAHIDTQYAIEDFSEPKKKEEKADKPEKGGKGGKGGKGKKK